jgi:hypothetical protein
MDVRAASSVRPVPAAVPAESPVPAARLLLAEQASRAPARPASEAGAKPEPPRRLANLPAPAGAPGGAAHGAPGPGVPAQKTQALLHTKDRMTKFMGWPGHFQPRWGALEGRHFGELMANIHAEVAEGAASAGLSMDAAAEAMRKTLLDPQQAPPLSPRMRGLAALLLYGAREMHREAHTLTQALAQHPVMRVLPAQEAWRLCVDQSAVGDGLHAGLRFDNEPGYMAGMYRALAQMVLQDAQGIDLGAGSFVDLHDTAVHGVFAKGTLVQGLERGCSSTLHAIEGFTAPGAGFPASLQGRGVTDALHVAGPGLEGIEQIRKGLRLPEDTSAVPLTVGGNASEKGLEELQAGGEPWCHVSQQVVMGNGRLASTPALHTRPKTAAELMGRIQACLDECRKDCTAAAEDPDVKLRAIALCCRNLEQLHPFPDGNARTIGVLVLNKLLLEQGLPPAALENANRLDAYSVAEVMQEIRVGQGRFAVIARDTAPPAV